MGMPPAECVAFLLVHGGRVLLEKRSAFKASDPGLTAIPGGHIERGETREQALERELAEELDIVPESYSYLCSLYHPTTALQLIHYYVVTRWQGTMTAREADEIAWHPLSDASRAIDIDADRVALSEYRRISNSRKAAF